MKQLFVRHFVLLIFFTSCSQSIISQGSWEDVGASKASIVIPIPHDFSGKISPRFDAILDPETSRRALWARLRGRRGPI